MHQFSTEKVLHADIDQVWQIVADFANLDWFAGAEKVEKIGDGIGQVRRIYMPGMAEPVDEKLLSLDNEQYSLEYEVLEGAVNVMQNYRVHAQLHKLGDGETKAVWQGQFDGVTVEGVEPQQMIDVMQQTYDGMLSAIEAHAKA